MKTKFLLAATLLALLVACGGGGGSDSTSASTATSSSGATLTGTVATGAALANAKITVKDSKGASKTATADANGNFSVDVTGMTAPLIIQAVSQGVVRTLYAISQTIPASNVINVTSITDSLALGSGLKPADVFADPVGKFASVDFAKLKTAQNNLKTALAAYLTALGVSASSDLVSTPFSADNTKVDALLDCLSNVSGVLSVKASCTGGAAVQAFNPAQDVAAVPAQLAAPAAGTLDYVKTNLPLINAQVKKLSDSLNAVSGDLATVMAALLDANGSYDEGMNKAAFIAEQVAKFTAGDRSTLYTGALVGFDMAANTVDLCLEESGTASGQALAGTTANTFKKINGVWQITTVSSAAKLACEKPIATVRAVTQYSLSGQGPLATLNSSYAVCIGKAPQVSVGGTLSANELCGPGGRASSAFDVSSWKPAAGTISLIGYFVKVDGSNKVLSASSAMTLDSTGALSVTDVDVCAGTSTPAAADQLLMGCTPY